MCVYGGWDGKKILDDLFVLDCNDFKWWKVESKRNFPRAYGQMLCYEKLLIFFGGRPDPNYDSSDIYRLNIFDVLFGTQKTMNYSTHTIEEMDIKSIKNKIDDYHLLCRIGRGNFGYVYLAQHKDHLGEEDKYVAIKRLKKYNIIKAKQVDHITSERDLLKVLSHPFMIETEEFFNDSKHIYMIMRFIPGGTLYNTLYEIYSEEPFSLDTIQFFISQVILFFDFLHEQGIIYRHLKPENLLIDNDGYIKVIGYGFLKKVEMRTYTICGTSEYMSPEMLLNRGYSNDVDWWTLGILIYELLNKMTPFESDDPMKIYEGILNNKILFRKKTPSHIKDLIQGLLNKDFTRVSISSIPPLLVANLRMTETRSYERREPTDKGPQVLQGCQLPSSPREESHSTDSPSVHVFWGHV